MDKKPDRHPPSGAQLSACMLRAAGALVATLVFEAELVAADVGLNAWPDDPCPNKGLQFGACEWTGDCSVPGCTNKCVANVTIADSYWHTSDAAFHTEWFNVCPRLAYLVEFAQVSTLVGAGRGLLSSDMEDGRPLSKQAQLEANLQVSAARGGLIPRHIVELSSELHGRRLQQIAQGTPCPSPQTIEGLSDRLAEFSSAMEDVLSKSSAGEDVSDVDPTWSFVTQRPNEAATIIPFLKNSTKLTEFMDQSCITGSVTAGSLQFQYYQPHIFLLEDPPFGAELAICRDNSDELEDFLGELTQVWSQSCLRPFNATEMTCLSDEASEHWAPLSRSCADGLAKVYDIPVEPLYHVAELMEDIQNACLNADSEVLCTSLSAPEEHHSILRAYRFIPRQGGNPLGPLSPIPPIGGNGTGAPSIPLFPPNSTIDRIPLFPFENAEPAPPDGSGDVGAPATSTATLSGAPRSALWTSSLVLLLLGTVAGM